MQLANRNRHVIITIRFIRHFAKNPENNTEIRGAENAKEHTNTWLVIIETVSDIGTVIFCFNLKLHACILHNMKHNSLSSGQDVQEQLLL